MSSSCSALFTKSRASSYLCCFVTIWIPPKIKIAPYRGFEFLSQPPSIEVGIALAHNVALSEQGLAYRVAVPRLRFGENLGIGSHRDCWDCERALHKVVLPQPDRPVTQITMRFLQEQAGLLGRRIWSCQSFPENPKASASGDLMLPFPFSVFGLPKVGRFEMETVIQG